MNRSNRLFTLVTAFVVAIACTSAATDRKLHFSDIFAKGQTKLLAAKLNDRCEKNALSQLAALEETTNEMSCETSKDIAKDVYQIASTTFDSATELIVDLNVIFNKLPSCLEEGSGVFKIVHILVCYARQFWDSVKAVKDFWNYPDYYKPIVKDIQEFNDCLHKKDKMLQCQSQT